MMIEMFPSGPFATNAIFLACARQKKGVFVDPALGSAEKLLRASRQKGIETIAFLLTHSHWDHCADLALLKKTLSVPVYVHRKDRQNVACPGSDGLPLPFPIEGVECDRLLEGGESIAIGDLQVEVIHTPGHTPGGVSFYSKEEGVLLSGDTLFKKAIGNLSFATANKKEMWLSLKRLSSLPSETVVYPGHGEPTTIGEERWLCSLPPDHPLFSS